MRRRGLTSCGKTRRVASATTFGRPSNLWDSWIDAELDIVRENGPRSLVSDQIVGLGPWTAPSGAEPTWNGAAFGSRAGWIFNGINSVATGSQLLRNGTGYTGDAVAIALMGFDSTVNTRYLLSGETSKTQLWMTSGGDLRAFNGSSSSSLFYTVSSTKIFTYRWRSTEGLQLFVNGVPAGTLLATHNQFKASASGVNTVIGRRNTDASFGFAGKLGFIGFKYGFMSNSEILADNQILMTLWGIS